MFLKPNSKKSKKGLSLQFPAFDHHFNNYIHHFVFYFIEEYNLLIFPRYCYSFISVDDSDFNQNPLSFRVLKFWNIRRKLFMGVSLTYMPLSWQYTCMEYTPQIICILCISVALCSTLFLFCFFFYHPHFVV